MKKILLATLVSLLLNGCSSAPSEPAAHEAQAPNSGDSTLLDSKDPTMQLADSVEHLD
ncbi:hypothetical protein [Hymenobacter seoulensis]